MLMKRSHEDHPSFINVDMGAVIPGKDSINEGLTEHLQERIAKLLRRQEELQNFYLFAPLRSMRERRERQNNIAKIAFLEQRLTSSIIEDGLRQERQNTIDNPGVTALPIDPQAQENAMEHSSDALIFDLQSYEPPVQAGLHYDSAADHQIAVVDNG